MKKEIKPLNWITKRRLKRLFWYKEKIENWIEQDKIRLKKYRKRLKQVNKLIQQELD